MSDYVKDNLILYVDGIKNNGEDKMHEDNTSSWNNIAGNVNYNINGQYKWEEKGLVFNGSNVWINCGEINPTQITLECLFEYRDNSITTGEINSIFGNWQSGGYGFQEKDGKNSFNVRIGGTWYHLYGSIVAVNTKYHLLGTYDGTYLKLYENGVLKDSVSVTGIIDNPANNTVLSIGSNPKADAIGITPLNGVVYMARIYNVNINDSYAFSNYNREYNRYIKVPENIFLIKDNDNVKALEGNILTTIGTYPPSIDLFRNTEWTKKQ